MIEIMIENSLKQFFLTKTVTIFLALTISILFIWFFIRYFIFFDPISSLMKKSEVYLPSVTLLESIKNNPEAPLIIGDQDFVESIVKKQCGKHFNTVTFFRLDALDAKRSVDFLRKFYSRNFKKLSMPTENFPTILIQTKANFFVNGNFVGPVPNFKLIDYYFNPFRDIGVVREIFEIIVNLAKPTSSKQAFKTPYLLNKQITFEPSNKFFTALVASSNRYKGEVKFILGDQETGHVHRRLSEHLNEFYDSPNLEAKYETKSTFITNPTTLCDIG